MTSEQRIMANRENSLKSTGPNDASITRFNSCKHALTSKKFLELRFTEELNEVRVELAYHFQPLDLIEAIVIDEMALARLKMLMSEKLFENMIKNIPLRHQQLQRRKLKLQALDRMDNVVDSSAALLSSEEQKVYHSPELLSDEDTPFIPDDYAERLERYSCEASAIFFRNLKRLINYRKNGFVS